MTAPTGSDRSTARRNGMVLAGLMAVVLGMVGLSFAAVPLYDLFCRVTGFGGTTQVAGGTTGEVLDRTVRVRFVGQTEPALPWRFRPQDREIELRIGEPGLTFFTAENVSERPVAGIAAYNVTPPKAGAYFTKVQCFCFNEQVLAPGEPIEFPVYFFLDPAMADDPGLDEVGTITLSYTFFEASSPGLGDAVEDYYQSIEEAEAMASAPAIN